MNSNKTKSKKNGESAEIAESVESAIRVRVHRIFILKVALNSKVENRMEKGRVEAIKKALRKISSVFMGYRNGRAPRILKSNNLREVFTDSMWSLRFNSPGIYDERR